MHSNTLYHNKYLTELHILQNTDLSKIQVDVVYLKNIQSNYKKINIKMKSLEMLNIPLFQAEVSDQFVSLISTKFITK